MDILLIRLSFVHGKSQRDGALTCQMSLFLFSNSGYDGTILSGKGNQTKGVTHVRPRESKMST